MARQNLSKNKAKPAAIGLNEENVKKLQKEGWKEISSTLDKASGYKGSLPFYHIFTKPRFLDLTPLNPKNCPYENGCKPAPDKASSKRCHNEYMVSLWANGGFDTFSTTNYSTGKVEYHNLTEIPTVIELRKGCKGHSFCVGFDTEFCYDDDTRRVLSYQFSFLNPHKCGEIIEVVFIPRSDCVRLLNVCDAVGFLVHYFGVYHLCTDGYYGVSDYSSRGWYGPGTVRNSDGSVKLVRAEYCNFDDLYENYCTIFGYDEGHFGINPLVTLSDDDLKAAADSFINLVMYGYKDKAQSRLHKSYKICGVDFDYGYHKCFPSDCALSVTLISHAGIADLTCLDFYEGDYKALAPLLSDIQGGLVSMQPITIKCPCYEDHHIKIPVSLSVRDSMCYAPNGHKKLSEIGDLVGLPKVELPSDYDKSDMQRFFDDKIVDFMDYACTDSTIAVVFCAKLWGVFRLMPPTLTSAVSTLAKSRLENYLVETRAASDTKFSFDSEFRGLCRRGKGLIKGNLPYTATSFYMAENMEPVSMSANVLQQVAGASYHGGYNASLRIGYYDTPTNDMDVREAYPTSMCITPDVDWSGECYIHEQNKLFDLDMVDSMLLFCSPTFATVRFEFPDTVKYPCIPVVVDGVPIYPRKIADDCEVCITAAELVAAHLMGAKIWVKSLYKGKPRRIKGSTQYSNSLAATVKQFVDDRHTAGEIFDVGSLVELLLKEAVNSIYGKLAQNIVQKSKWSVLEQQMIDIGDSKITSPVHASITTAIMRTALILAVEELESKGFKVYSVTTDGLITDASESEMERLELRGMSRYIQLGRKRLRGNSDCPGDVAVELMWKQKHTQNHLINLTTRGNVGVESGGVLAHNGIVTDSVYKGVALKDSDTDRAEYVYMAATRTGRVRSQTKSFVNWKEYNEGVDFQTYDRASMISLDFDLKRKPDVDTMQTVVFEVLNPNTGVMERTEMVCFDTLPYTDIDEYKLYRNTAKLCKCLRTQADWDVFRAKLTNAQARKENKALPEGERKSVPRIKDLRKAIIMSCLIAYRQQIPLKCLDNKPLQLKALETRAMALKLGWINRLDTQCTTKITESDYKNCGRKERVTQMLDEDTIEPMIKIMIEKDTSF